MRSQVVWARAARAAGRADERVTFHSWRHTFADMCRAAGVAPDVRMVLMGHSEGGAAGVYGSGEFSAQVLAGAIRKLKRGH